MASTMIHSHCVQLTCYRVSDCTTLFGKKDSAGQIPLVLIPGHRSAFSIGGWFLTIPTGCHCLMQKFGQ
ncbi:unnamed protein product, partial [Polarella glacialis]